MKGLVWVRSEDHEWQGVYYNGTLIYEGHDIQWDVVLGKIGVPLKDIKVSNAWMESEGRLPFNLIKLIQMLSLS